MKCGLEMCLTAARRTLRDSPVSVRQYGTGVVLCSKPSRVNPNTVEQQASRDVTRRLAAGWRGLTAQQQQEWNAAAERLIHEFSREQGRLTGYMLYSQCARNRLTIGEPLPAHAPGGFLRPNMPDSVELLPSGDPGTFELRMHHRIRNISAGSYRVLVHQTPATIWNSRKPETRNRALIRGHSAASAPVLPASGQTISFTQARFAVEPGKRFGIWIRIIHLPSGLASEEMFLDLHRTGTEPSASSTLLPLSSAPIARATSGTVQPPLAFIGVHSRLTRLKLVKEQPPAGGRSLPANAAAVARTMPMPAVPAIEVARGSSS